MKNPFPDTWFIAVILESWKELLFLKYKMNLFEWLDLLWLTFLIPNIRQNMKE